MSDDEKEFDEFGAEVEPGDDAFLKKGKSSSIGEDFDDEDLTAHDPETVDIAGLIDEEDEEDDLNFGDEDDHE